MFEMKFVKVDLQDLHIFHTDFFFDEILLGNFIKFEFSRSALLVSAAAPSAM
jgi:hypothetical protein